MSISLPPKGSAAKKLGSYFTPLKVEAQASPNMTVRVSEGSFWTANNEYVEYIGGTSPNISAPLSDAKWVLVTITSNGMINIVDGVPSGNPELPPPSTYKNELPLAAIFVGDTTTAITNDMIFDLRPLWSIPPDSVSQDQLNDFATKIYVDNGLALKANIDGTNSANFTLNLGGASINDSGIYIDRYSGPNVGIRFNETASYGSPPTVTPMWEFTNDGVTWNPIGVSSGNYYTKSDLNSGALDFRYFTQNDLLVTGSLDVRYYTQDYIDNNFAPDVHQHQITDIIGLANPINTINGRGPDGPNGEISFSLNDLSDVFSTGPAESHVIVYRNSFGEYRNEQLSTNDLSDIDTSSNIPTVGEVLIHTGSLFANRKLVKADISDFTGGEFVLVTNVAGDPYDPLDPSTWVDQSIWGLKTFENGIVVKDSLTVTGNNTSIETTELRVKDPHIDLNYQNAITDPSAFTAGIRIDRSTIAGSPSSEPPAIIQWDENAGQWEFGVVGSTQPILGGSHTHNSTQVVDFAARVTSELNNNNNLNEIADVTYVSAPSTGDYLRYGAVSWENRNFASDFTAELNVNSLNELSDVTYLGSPSLSVGNFLQWDGTQWVNHIPVKSDISDFVESDYIHTTGNETKVGDLTINGNFTVGNGVGSVTTINSETVNIRDSVITLNAGESGNGVSGGSGTSGIMVDRGGYQDAMLWWSEAAGTWLAHYSVTGGSPISPSLAVGQLSFVGHNHVLTDITDVSVTASEVNSLAGIYTGARPHLGATPTVSQQILDTITRVGDTMDPGANLVFQAGGEVLGLPTTPSSSDAAVSKYYADTTFVDAAGDTMSGNLDMGTINRIVNVADPVDPNDVVNFGFADNRYLNVSGDTMLGDINMGLNSITNLADPLANDHAVNLGFADNRYVNVTGDTMTGQLNMGLNDIVFAGGEVLGLPATPSVPGAATSAAYVDAHINDNTVHLDAPQNTFLDGLQLTGTPALTSADVNQLIGITGNVQALLDTKTDKLVPAVDRNLAALDIATGNIVDSGVVVNDSGTTVNEIWTANKIDTTKADKIVPALVGNLAGLDATGNLTDSGLILNDSGNLVSEIWSANKIDTTKADKVVGAVNGNFAALDGSGNLLDSGANISTFALASHTHVSTEITDWATAFTTELGNNSINALGDVTNNVAQVGDFLRWNGTIWDNVPPSSITAFVRGTGNIDETVTGQKTFQDAAFFQSSVSINGVTSINNNLTVTGNLTVQGDQITIGDEIVTSPRITLNSGGDTASAEGGGVILDRDSGSPITQNPAAILWDETGGQRWKAGVYDPTTGKSSIENIALENTTVAQPYYDLQTASGAAVYTLPFGVPAPIAGKTGIQVFVNGIKQIEGVGKAYTVDYSNPAQTVVTFNAGSEPALGDDVEFYGFGYIA